MTETERSPSRLSKPMRFVGVASAAVGGLAWLVVPVVAAFFVAKFARVLADLDAELPALTCVLIAVTTSVSQYWYLLAVPWLVVVGLLVSASARGKSRWPIWVSCGFAGASLVVLAVFLALMVVGLFVPMQRLTETVGGG